MIDSDVTGTGTLLANRWDMETDTVVTLCYQILEEVQQNVTVNW